MLKSRIFFLLILIIQSKVSMSQNRIDQYACGNRSTGKLFELPVQKEFIPNHQYQINLNSRGEIPIVVYYAYSSADGPSISKYQVDRMLEQANFAFGDPFYFVVDQMIPVFDTSLLTIEGAPMSDEYQMVYQMFTSSDRDAQKIHLYFPYDTENICGLSSFPLSDKQGMIISGTSGCIGSKDDPQAQVLIHELGHYFNHQHTFHNFNTSDFSERVTRDDRCKFQGDGFCDTPADFFPSYKYQTDFCGFDPYSHLENSRLPVVAKDIEGILYHPSTHNFMSYFTPSCLSEFTPEQRAMLQRAFEYRVHRPIATQDFLMFPNPAQPTDSIQIHFDHGIEILDSLIFQLQIITMSGQEISSQIISNETMDQSLSSIGNFNISFLARGTYVVNLKIIHSDSNQMIYNHSEKLIVH